ncbi:MAG: SMI1/KNR4 family protein [Planctomycetaceae bacterium]|nr:SMI1/KNR4 family protein [Planctomycetaceae bacterium]
MSQQVLNRLREQVARAGGNEAARTPFPPATPELVAEAENQLGFELNPFLKQVYLEVGNGGFGPSYGLLGLPGGATDDQGQSIVDNYRGLAEYFAELWPEKLVPICHYGCGMLGCVDCSASEGAMTTWHPGLPPDDIQLWWKDNFVAEGVNIVEWFAAWLDTTDADPSPN